MRAYVGVTDLGWYRSEVWELFGAANGVESIIEMRARIGRYRRVPISPRLRNDFGNGEQFYTQAGQVIQLPHRRVDRPHREFLEGSRCE